ncbi:uncharacterized protein yeiB [Asticcacaulis biprosthecium C19]|uniref:Uncharacterized protein yeiB n=1 Tax=Asticcacaulis biprosthecium C19 TaxID=715226 RepID=F4QGQ6_9CAUL|nr:DUF418 domain-containing protein [Asticcacaulis biprosthecium]EGF92508.1 uncharacterized protein yeiB [Asticcacaulis biprosthecium C19]
MTAAERQGGRFAALDHIRGLSILGILIVNAIAFAQPFDVYVDPRRSPVPMSPADDVAWWAIETFARDKFITLFSLLFGVSIFLVGETGERPLQRRLIWLLVFGVIHGALIWHGDILFLYAVTGLVFMQWRERPASWLIAVGAVVYAVTTAALVGIDVLAQFIPMGLELPDRNPAYVEQMRSGFLSSLTGNAWQWAQDVIAAVIVFGPHTLGLMMLGLGLFKAGFLKGESRNGLYGLAVAAGLIALVPLAVMNLAFVQGGYRGVDFWLVFDILDKALPLVISLGYAAILIVIARTGAGGLLYPLACAGRMAFTNYLMQSVIMTALFYGGRAPAGTVVLGYELPLYGTLNHASLVPIVAAIWVGQLLFSMLWLQVFRYGPFEWGWRCLTYRRWMPILNSR